MDERVADDCGGRVVLAVVGVRGDGETEAKRGKSRRPAEPAPRRPHDIIALAAAGKRKRKKNNKNRTKRPAPKAVRKRPTASIADDATDVISAVFDQAEARDPAQP
jgi:hypothetical protein